MTDVERAAAHTPTMTQGAVNPPPRLPAERPHHRRMTIEQLRAAEWRALGRINANRPGDRQAALRALQRARTQLRNRILEEQ